MNPKIQVRVVDRLSELPDEILVKILSFLPIVDAVRTMLLKRFGSLWTFLPNLDFEQLNFYIRLNTLHDDVARDNVGLDHYDLYQLLNLAFLKFVHNVLMRHRRPNVTRFRVLFGDTFYDDGRHLTQELDRWIDFAMRKNVEILDFNVCVIDPFTKWWYKLPHTVFVSNSIREMNLSIVEMKFVTRVQMGMLRVLRLLQVDISNDVFQEIIRGCPLLKELEMYMFDSDSKLSLNAPNVETLILDTSYADNHGLIVDCPNLRSFHFTGCDKCFEVKDLSSLVDVTFHYSSCCSWSRELKDFEHFMIALKPVFRAKLASFSCASLVVLFYCMQTQPSESSMDWKRVTLNMWSTKKHVPGVCRLLRNSPYLEELVIHLTSSSTLNVSSVKHFESKLDNCSMWIEECSTSSLKRVVIYNASMCFYSTLVPLVRTLLKNASTLAELEIYYKASEKSSLDELEIYYMASEKSSYEAVLPSCLWTKFCNRLPKFTTTSQHVRVSLIDVAPPLIRNSPSYKGKLIGL